MAKKQADTAPDLRAELKKRIKHLDAFINTLQEDLRTSVNERAHWRQYYIGRIEQVAEEAAYLRGLLDG